jgi:hypothetical protein
MKEPIMAKAQPKTSAKAAPEVKTNNPTSVAGIPEKKNADGSTGDDIAGKSKQDAAAEAAKAKIAEKAAKNAAKAEAKEKADATKAEKSTATAEARAKAKAEREERIAALQAEGRKYIGSMIALTDRVKTGVYIKGTTGQLRCTDELAEALDGVGPNGVVQLAKHLLNEETNKYAHLNVGQQSMNYRNRMRGAITKGALTLDAVKAAIVELGIDATELIQKAAVEKAARVQARKDEAAAKEAAKAKAVKEPAAT